MKDEAGTLNTPNDACVNDSLEYPFDKALQDRAVQFLKSLTQKQLRKHVANQLVTHLVPSSDGSPSGFVESILTLLSSRHSTMVVETLSLLSETTSNSSTEFQSHLMESDLITNVFVTIQPHSLPISGNDKIFDSLLRIINTFLLISFPMSLRELAITTVVKPWNHREMIFQKVVLPSSQYVTFLITNRHILVGEFSISFMILLATLLGITPYHRPTSDFVLTSPIAMALTSCLSFVEDGIPLWSPLFIVHFSMSEWIYESPEAVQSGKRMIKALFSEGFEDTLDQMMIHEKEVSRGVDIVYYSCSISQLLETNVTEM
ncbi:hypothetical protein BLNAU_18865 [Blattamonas nauphoetae]|uniref:Uncharacterized protein n=1 Tax=Blattamonas nauphoetae TaxID=2049346 RepID=A0ABQ9X354_9EUKA|nr:hypothetical protein BLNAU_18865 [Blattamonas nauphoetae]